MSTFEPGTVAIVTWDEATMVAKARGESDIQQSIALRGVDGWALPGTFGTWIADPTDVRPLVTLDPEDREQLDRLTKALVEAAYAHGNAPVAHNGIHPDTLSRALRSLTKPPKPEEPTGLGAVIEDAEGKRWTHPNLHPRGEWFSECGDYERTYDDIDAVRVLSEGVTP